VELLAINVKEVEYMEVTGLKLAVTPLGSPDAAKVTVPLKPFWPLM
jgi:hypothetical protein